MGTTTKKSETLEILPGYFLRIGNQTSADKDTESSDSSISSLSEQTYNGQRIFEKFGQNPDRKNGQRDMGQSFLQKSCDMKDRHRTETRLGEDMRVLSAEAWWEYNF